MSIAGQLQENSSLNFQGNNGVVLPSLYTRTTSSLPEQAIEAYVVAPVTTVPVNLNNLTTAQLVFIITDQPITLNFSGGISIPIEDFFYAHMSFTTLTLQNLSLTQIANVQTTIYGV